MIPYADENKGYKYLLTVIDVFSKYAWARPVKRKTGDDVTAAMKSIFEMGRIPKNLHTDNGKEFYNSKFSNLMKKHYINLYFTYSNLKASICERFNGTLKNKMFPQFSLHGNYQWLHILPALINDYNNSTHRNIKMKPQNVNKDNQKELLERVYNVIVNEKIHPKFKVCQQVRISKFKHIFEKGYTPNWTTEVFKIIKVKKNVSSIIFTRRQCRKRNIRWI
ncbi:hypothetical protein DD595_24885 [Enterobacter cloacae complex sp. 4DZ3-17B2]|nr:hypothetical protein DD595_24885 [Enterobacter cloacae complex sp. 4DZ3-17B2]